jgi:16S rRNA (cytosine1402-N4)-methyltransferase
VIENQGFHKSVLYQEVLEALSVIPGEVYVDATLGGGGHTEGILQNGGKVIALDVDSAAIDFSSKRLGARKEGGVWVTPTGNLTIYQSNFRHLDSVVKEEGVKSVSGILFDLGVSSFMLEAPERGFSFVKEGPLDMRMDQSLQVRAVDLVNALNEGELYELFSKLGEEPHARRFARDIVSHRLNKRIETTRELAEIIDQSLGRVFGIKKEINPSTRVFMALRIAVNDELNNLKEALPKAVALLKRGGRLVIISFHSLEDRIVKEFLKKEATLKILTKKPLIPTQEEIRENPRARSAKMRVAERI